MKNHRLVALLLSTVFIAFGAAAERKDSSYGKPFLKAELIFPLEHLHNHGSCIVECPNGDLLVCWYNGSGERTADDVKVLGARKRKGDAKWSQPFLLADTPGYPDTNPALFIDPQQRLWLLWSVVLDNQWESVLLKYRIATDYYRRPGAPHWECNEVLHVTPATNFAALVNAGLDHLVTDPPATMPTQDFTKWIATRRELANRKLSQRLGWMTRVHPYVLDGRRLIVPLYSGGFEFSLMAISDDWGKNWFTSQPIVGLGNVQPSLVQRRDGTLVAYMRDNGPPPQRIPMSQSTDRGVTWSAVVDSDRVDSGTGVEALVLRNGLWLITHNDLDDGRHRLAVSLSDDEGKTWKWTRHLEQDSEADLKTGAGMYHYPSVIQARDGTLHVSYSIRQKRSKTERDTAGRLANEAIKHAHFNVAWVMQGD